MTKAISTTALSANLSANLELVQPSVNQRVWTDEQFMALPEDGNLYEFVDGELVILANSGVEHGY